MNSLKAGALAIALIGGAAPSLAQSYRITDLGAAAGDYVSGGYGLNDLGEAAGVSSNPTGDIGTLFSGGQAINIGRLEPNDVVIATAINHLAQVVGYEPFSSSPGNLFHAFLYSNGTMSDITSLSLFPQGASAAGINGSGEIVGKEQLDAYSFHAFLYANGHMTDLGPPGSYQASAVAINDSGQIAGNSYFTGGGGGAFIYSNGVFNYLPPPAGTTASAFAISSTGEVAGALYLSTGGAHAAVYTNGAWTDLGAFQGVATHAMGVNSTGQVIGTAYFPTTSYHPYKPGKHVAIIARNGALVDLNTLVPANSGFTITDGIAINDSGEILCNATNSSGHKHAALLTPR